MLILLSTFFQQAFANSTAHSADAESMFELDMEKLMNMDITSASRRSEAVMDAPANVVIVTKQEIHERGYLNLLDLLRGEAGIDTHEYSHETTYSRIAIRGVVGNNKFLIQQDGISIGSPAGDPIPIADNISLMNAARVEIVFGPGSALYGANAFTGVVNIITDTGNTNESRLGTYMGKNNYRYLYGQSNYQLSEKVSFNFFAHIHESDNPDLSKTYQDIYNLGELVDFDSNVVIPADQREGYYSDTNSHSISLRMDVGDDFSLGYHQSQFESPTSTGLDPNRVDYASKASWASLIGTIYSRYETDIDATTSTRILFTHSFYEVDPASKFNNLFSNYDNGYKYAKTDKTELDAQLNFEFNEDNKFVIGGVIEQVISLPKTADLTEPYNSNITSQEQVLYYGGTNDTLPVKFYNTSYSNVGAFLQYRRSWSNTFDTILGARYDNNSRYGSSLNPRIGIIHKPDNRMTFKLLYGEAFLAPAPEFTYEHFGAFTGTTNTQGDYVSNFFFIPNTDLKPEEIQTLEANYSYLFSSDFLFGLSIYHSQVDNLILNTSTPIPESDFIEGGFITATSHNDNVGDLDVTGMDIKFSYQSRFKRSSLKAWGSYTYTEGSMRDTLRNLKVDLPFVAKNKVKLGFTYSYRKKYYLTPLINWIDETSTDVPDLSPGQTGSKVSREYTLVDLNAGMKDIVQGLSLNLSVRNVLDKKYYNAGTGVNITLAETPQNPRLFTLGLTYEF